MRKFKTKKALQDHVKKQLKEIKSAIGVVLDRKLYDVCNDDEATFATAAYNNLLILHNRLHRHLI